MPVLEHYYTSYVNREQGNAGFQVKAMSPGISPEQQALIARLIGYRIPPGANEYEVKSHPIALRYYYKDPHECVFLCSQSNGGDENGRPGNFFAHTLVMDPTNFSGPPIFYWRSSFWRTKDAETRTQLPTRPEFDLEPSLDIDQVWEFLAAPQRREQFYKLMCAVVHYEKTHRRIIIIDSADNVALWIATISCMLPIEYRQLLSFATYHHDPYQAQFMFVGTTPDSAFRASPEEYMSFFILNAVAGKISDIEDSPYAKLAAQALTAEAYESLLLPFFADYVPRFPMPTRIDEQLDAIARYYKLLSPPYPTTLSPDEIQAIHLALDVFTQQKLLNTEDLEQIDRLGQITWDSFKAHNEPAIYDEYKRIRQLLDANSVGKNIIPTQQRIKRELQLYTEQLLTIPEPQQAAARVAELQQLYGEKVLFDIIHQTDYLPMLTKRMERASARHYQRLWQYLGPYLRPNAQSQPLLLITLDMADTLLANKQQTEEDELRAGMENAMRGREQAWLKQAVTNNTRPAGQALKNFYYALIYQLPLEQRSPYRQLIPSEHQSLIRFEIRSDVMNEIAEHGPKAGLQCVEEWITYAQKSLKNINAAEVGLKQLRTSCTPEQWAELAPRILMSQTIAPLAADLKDELVQLAFAPLRFSHYNPSDLEFYRTYQKHTALSETTRTILAGILAMQSKKLSEELSERIHQYVATLQRQEYQQEIHQLLSVFYSIELPDEMHILLLDALFTNRYPTYFWKVYWDVFTKILTNAGRAPQAVQIFTFWFSVPPKYFHYIRYAPQAFFLHAAPELVDCKAGGGRNALQPFLDTAKPQPWFPVIQDVLAEKKNAFQAAGQAVLHAGLGVLKIGFQRMGDPQDKKLKAQQEEKERLQQQQQEQEKAQNARIGQLFDGKSAVATHEKYLAKIYQELSPEDFWRLYWKKYARFLVTSTPEQTLDILSFWFDTAYVESGQTSYIAQEFFLGLVQALEMAQKERDYGKAATNLRNTGRQFIQQRNYGWYALLDPLLGRA